ncbi:PcfJ domain-containing protein [Bacteroides fragilis]
MVRLHRPAAIFGKDLHNAHFVCPADLPAAHDLYMAKNGGTCKWNGGRRNGARRWNRKPRLSKPKGGFRSGVSDGEICIRVLDSVEAIRQEGEAMHHCVFTNEYYLKADSLILSATIDGKRIETIEVSLKRMEVVQSRGVCNKNTPYHGQILKLMKGNMSLIRKRMTA